MKNKREAKEKKRQAVACKVCGSMPWGSPKKSMGRFLRRHPGKCSGFAVKLS